MQQPVGKYPRLFDRSHAIQGADLLGRLGVELGVVFSGPFVWKRAAYDVA